MTKPPPENLMEWPKAQLAREVDRLRAITREHADRLHDDARSGGDSAGGSPHGRGDAVLDTRGAVLLDYNEVILVDTKQDQRPAMALILEGRVNYEHRRVKQMYLFGPDGAAAIITQLIGLAGRGGVRRRVQGRPRAANGRVAVMAKGVCRPSGCLCRRQAAGAGTPAANRSRS